ncbi:DinB family protein [Cohnella candidum]|uniref:DUF664 domain-containing protein n=1 Tax=Cohnella candidum TaxID=2674991 RepID=A0A3G3JW76_9BACL|nr:DinB family protein [Cohnella candidum]AYQ72107.1 DUF664 domain-containing protein [Cohnella candidum]
MLKLFQYNWQVREEWFALCRGLPQEELLKERTGGVGSILKTLFHIVEAEYSWIDALKGNSPEEPDFNDYRSLERVEQLQAQYRPDVLAFVEAWTDEQEIHNLIVPWNTNVSCTYGEVMRHVIAHEIHHVGQLSVWSRELGIKPPSANFVGRGLA